MLEEMIPEELERLKTHDFKQLWDLLWTNHKCRAYTTDYLVAKRKFETLNLDLLLADIQPKWQTQEYGIPKGRRNGRESDLMCAMREFEEETGLTAKDYTVDSHPERVLEETFIGSNGTHYRHVYYLARLHDDVEPRINPDNVTQTSEIRSIGMYTLKECLAKLRDYDVTKRSVLVHANKQLMADLPTTTHLPGHVVVPRKNPYHFSDLNRKGEKWNVAK